MPEPNSAKHSAEGCVSSQSEGMASPSRAAIRIYGNVLPPDAPEALRLDAAALFLLYAKDDPRAVVDVAYGRLTSATNSTKRGEDALSGTDERGQTT